MNFIIFCQLHLLRGSGTDNLNTFCFPAYERNVIIIRERWCILYHVLLCLQQHVSNVYLKVRKHMIDRVHHCNCGVVGAI